MNDDLSSLFEKFNIDKDSISPDAINNILNMLNNNDNNNSSNTSSSDEKSESSSSNIDIGTIMKMKSVMEKMNSKDDPRSTLLMSLKPYLKESRQGKVDQYIKLMNMSKVMDVFTSMGGESKQ